MQIIIKEVEIRAAVQAYIAAQGINLSGKDVTIEFSATRSGAGIIAEIDIGEMVPATATATAPTAAAPTVFATEDAGPVTAKAGPTSKMVSKTTSTAETKERSASEIASAAMNAPLDDDQPKDKEEPKADPKPAAAASSLFG